ncbi:MAG: hypothetical protein HYX34_01560 [Actinobacteria bacterium]|nr:hypothetical protein [Actinomycetota bacterium]
MKVSLRRPEPWGPALWGIYGLALATIGGAWGLSVALLFGILVVLGWTPRRIGFLAVAIAAVVPVAVVGRGLPTAGTISAEFVSGNLWANRLALAAFALAAGAAVLDAIRWAQARRAVDDHGARIVGRPGVMAKLVSRGTGSHVFRGSLWASVAIAVQSTTGAAYWFLATRVASNGQIGRASALYSSLQFVNYASGLGLTVTLARYAHEDDGRRLLGWFSIITSTASLVAVAGFLGVVDSKATGLVRQTAAGQAYFFLLTAGASIGLLVDVWLMWARRWGWLLAKTSIIGFVRLPLLFVHGVSDPARWLFAVITVPQAIMGLAFLVLVRPLTGRWPALGRAPSLRPALRFAGVNWVGLLSTQAPQFLVPVVVAVKVRAETYAYFYLAWTMTSVVFLIPGTIAQVLLVESAKSDTSEQRRRSREAFLLAGGIALGAFLVSLPVARASGLVFGRPYRPMRNVLPPLMLGCIPWAVAAIALAEARLRHDLRSILGITLATGTATVGLTFLLVPRSGVSGAVQAWLVGNSIGAAVALLLRRRRRPPMQDEELAIFPAHLEQEGMIG